ncbi:putative monooxygenase [Myriangium duriaei CBS 260.36]|uniref:Monooxygenase n=1 Tax=Myriangium duriaei CBS 260.36 TaxID=1168546 RepID=A0A9P4J2A5_9PEZI|nr:putative monooxygenase [Myriangium duriaei CBS 260.36]
MPDDNHQDERLEIAIIGGGIVGLILAAGLVRRNVDVKLYEQARGFREIGAGIAFTANAIKCMNLINPDIVSALRSGGSVATSADKEDPNDYLRWTDGYNERAGDPRSPGMLYRISAGIKGFEGCRRDQFLEALVEKIPPEVVFLRKRLTSLSDSDDNDRVILTFEDGTLARADAVIACDGIKSTVRRLMYGTDSPISHPHYTHKVAYRTLIPMPAAIEALGNYRATNQHNHIGPGAHLIHYPVAHGKLINATAFISDPHPWPSDTNLVAPGSRTDIVAAFKDWIPAVRDVINLFPEQPERWAVFDSYDYPAPHYNKGRVVLAGDAAHAASPHHGAGACMGVEDVLCLCTLAEEIHSARTSLPSTARAGAKAKAVAIKNAWQVFDSTRRARTQWLVNSSRRVCELYHQPEWAVREKWTKAETCFEEIQDRSLKIWNFDYEDMIKITTGQFRLLMHAGQIDVERIHRTTEKLGQVDP